MKNIFRALAGLLLLSTCPGASHAQQYLLDFDTDALGNPIPEGALIDEQYAAWGIHFVPNIAGGVNATGSLFATNTDMTATATDFDPAYLDFLNSGSADPLDFPSGNLLHSFAGYLLEDGDANFWIRFDESMVQVRLSAYSLSALFDPSFAVYGLDADLNFVSFGQFNYSPSGASAVVTLESDAGISYLAITGSIDFGAYDQWSGIDSIQVTVAPEPGTLALGILGLSASVRRRRRSP